MMLWLLLVIYLAFISLGLPDSILGSVWPLLYVEFDVPLSYAGIVTLFTSGFTILSSLLSDRTTRRFGTGAVTTVSTFLTALGLFGFSFSTSFPMLLLFTLPYGLGAGAIDAALNNYVALHYTSRHMSWLHCFWGVGTIISPTVVSYALRGGAGWSAGYRAVGFLQLAIGVVLVLALPLWKKVRFPSAAESETPAEIPTMKTVLRIPGVVANLFAFFGYCALEVSCFLWASTYFVKVYAVAEETAAGYAALGYGGITAGRFLCGFFAERLGDKRMIRLGSGVILLGILLLAIPADSYRFAFAGFLTVGFGCAPIYPSIVHATPLRFGKANSQAIIGIQMAFAYTGFTLIPLFFGILADFVHLRILPLFMLAFLLLTTVMTERVNRVTHQTR